MQYISLNYKISETKDLKLSFENRGFLFGDGFFETIKVINKLDKSEISIIDSINISAQTGLNIEMLIQNIVEIFQSDKRRLYGDFQKITLQKDDLIINQDHGKYICTGRFVESIIGLSGNKDEVNNEIFYRYENSYLPNKLEELGVVDGDTIMLGNLEFEYKK